MAASASASQRCRIDGLYPTSGRSSWSQRCSRRRRLAARRLASSTSWRATHTSRSLLLRATRMVAIRLALYCLRLVVLAGRDDAPVEPLRRRQDLDADDATVFVDV